MDKPQSQHIGVLLKEFAEKCMRAQELGMDLSVLPIMPISGSLDELLTNIENDNFELSVDANWFDMCSQIVQSFLAVHPYVEVLDELIEVIDQCDPSYWYRNLSKEKQEIVDYLQVFEYTVVNSREEIDLDWYRLDNPELVVGLGMDCVGNGTSISDLSKGKSEVKMVHFREALKSVAREIPNDWFDMNAEECRYPGGIILSTYRRNMKKDIDDLIKEMDREHLKVIK